MQRWSDKNWNLASCQKLLVNQKFIKHYWVITIQLQIPAIIFAEARSLDYFTVETLGYKDLKLWSFSLSLSLLFTLFSFGLA